MDLVGFAAMPVAVVGTVVAWLVAASLERCFGCCYCSFGRKTTFAAATEASIGCPGRDQAWLQVGRCCPLSLLGLVA